MSHRKSSKTHEFKHMGLIFVTLNFMNQVKVIVKAFLKIKKNETKKRTNLFAQCVHCPLVLELFEQLTRNIKVLIRHQSRYIGIEIKHEINWRHQEVIVLATVEHPGRQTDRPLLHELPT